MIYNPKGLENEKLYSLCKVLIYKSLLDYDSLKIYEWNSRKLSTDLNPKFHKYRTKSGETLITFYYQLRLFLEIVSRSSVSNQ